MTTLYQEMERCLRHWRCHLDQSWLDVLGAVEPDFKQLDDGEMFCADHPVFPTFEGIGHVFRAFNGLSPANVKIVLIGQDPYPCIDRATGRSFEQGDLHNWAAPLANNRNQSLVSCARSLQSIVQQLAAFHTHCRAYSNSRGGWDAFQAAYAQGRLLDFPTRQEMFDQWQSEGVLMLNAILTFTRKSQQIYHHKLWQPFVRKILSYLACQKHETCTVFMCFGKRAWDILDPCIQKTLTCRKLVVRRKHPVLKHKFLAERNVFEEANDKLVAATRSPVRWVY